MTESDPLRNSMGMPAPTPGDPKIEVELTPGLQRMIDRWLELCATGQLSEEEVRELRDALVRGVKARAALGPRAFPPRDRRRANRLLRRAGLPPI